MYTGHYGIALMGKSLRVDVPLWMLIGAAFSFDLINLVLKLAGAAGAWTAWVNTAVGAVPMAAAVGGVYWAARRDGHGARLMAMVALLHVPVDLMTNKTTLWPDGPRVGAALYQHPVLDALVEIALVAVGWWLYRKTLPRRARNAWPAWGMLIMLSVLQIMFSLGGL